MLDTSTFFFAFLGGVLPASLWLWFWLKEDRISPEPRSMIITTFCAGMVATLVALVLENILREYIPFPGKNLGLSGIIFIMLWASIEEFVKFSAAYYTALSRRENDEPIDNMIYLITAALGFAALENALFLIDPIKKGLLIDSLINGNLRFIGSTLLHVVSSASIGIFMAFAFCKLPNAKRLLTTLGFIFAILLHTLFNYYILVSEEGRIFGVFGALWVGVVILLLFFERAKKINRSCVY
ncbi:MAG: PrsW family glutamic-type intramembrane protease [Patescibacteria group bacterium]